jgi:hypothetical protein
MRAERNADLMALREVSSPVGASSKDLLDPTASGLGLRSCRVAEFTGLIADTAHGLPDP